MLLFPSFPSPNPLLSNPLTPASWPRHSPTFFFFSFFFLFFFFPRAEGQIQGLALARQSLYHWAKFPTPKGHFSNCFLISADFEVLHDADAGGWGAVGPRPLYCHHNAQDTRTDAVLLWRAVRWRHLKPFGSWGRKGSRVRWDEAAPVTCHPQGARLAPQPPFHS